MTLKAMVEAPYDVFISHSSRNADLANVMKQYLATRGIRCWKAPDDIEPSEPWPSAIMRGLRQCQIVVLIWTKESMASTEVLKEITFADQKTKAIIPFRAEEITPDGGLEYFLVAKQWLDAHADYEKALEALASTALRILGRHNPTAGPSEATPPAPQVASPAIAATLSPAHPSPSESAGSTLSTLLREEASDSDASERTDRGRFLARLREADVFAADGELRTTLGWNDKKFDKVKQALLDDDKILSGTGRGGSCALPTPKLLQLREELSNEALPGCVFVNVGEAKEEGNTARDWGRCMTYGFISAGYGSRYINDMKRIKPGAIVFAYSSGAGYVGMGTALEAAVPVSRFLVDGVPLIEKAEANASFFHHLDDPEMCEWLVRVRWDKTFGREQAIYRTGLFVHVATSCRLKDAITVCYLRSRFNSFLEAPTITEADYAS